MTGPATGSGYGLRWEIRDRTGRRVGEPVGDLHAAIRACQDANRDRPDADALVAGPVYVPDPVRC